MVSRALSPEQIDTLADKYIMNLYKNLEQEVIGDIARRVKKTGRFTETAELMAQSMAEKGYSPSKIRADVMKAVRADNLLQDCIAYNTLEYKKYVKRLIKETEKEARKAGDALMAEAGDMAWNEDMRIWEEAGQELNRPKSLEQISEAYSKQTNGQLKNLTRSMGFKNMAFESVENAYQLELDKALVKMASGTFSYDVCVRDCVKALANSGLRTIDYASGRSYQLDTAARMCLRTGMSQLAGKVTEKNIENTGVSLVITSQHMGSRPEHVPWQNKVFSYDGKNKKYPDFVSSTGYGTATGLKGVNCMHDFYPFWEGISVIPDDFTEPKPVTVNGKTYTHYEASQKQRSMERSIRAAKREIEATKVIGGDVADLNAKLRKQVDDYYDFSKKVGIKAKDNRLGIIRGTSDLSKTKSRKNTTNTVQNGAKNDIIKINLQMFASKEKQYGKKIGKHARDFGLDPSNEEHRRKMVDIIRDIKENSTEIRIGKWRGQEEEVLFHVKGNDAVLTKKDGEFITVIKDGVINSERIKNARRR